jgi:exosortase
MTTAPLAPAVPASRASAAPAARGLMVAALLALVYHRTLVQLAEVWSDNENYSHGPLVPLASLAIAWLRRDRLAAAPPRPDARGLALVAAACALQVAGMRADVFTLQGWSLVVMAFGLSLTFLGGPRTRVLWFPLAYLGFMLTFPPIVVNQLGFALKEVTIAASTAIAEALGVLLRRDGMSLYLAGGELRVENPCSGLRSLIALLATGAVFAYFQRGGPGRRALLFVSAVPVAMAANVVRITLLLLVAHYAGLPQATGAFHDVSGVLLYAAALAGLLGMRRLLARRPARPAAARPAPARSEARP